MEEKIVQETNGEAKNFLNNLFKNDVAEKRLLDSFQNNLKDVRMNILNTFVKFYNDKNTICHCKKMIEVAPTINGIDQSKISYFQQKVNELCSNLKSECKVKANENLTVKKEPHFFNYHYSKNDNNEPKRHRSRSQSRNQVRDRKIRRKFRSNDY